jgi:hypothetical protein
MKVTLIALSCIGIGGSFTWLFVSVLYNLVISICDALHIFTGNECVNLLLPFEMLIGSGVLFFLIRRMD